MADSLKIVTVEDDNGHAGICECAYITSGWPTRKIASARIRQHRTEHETGEPMQLLSEFRAENGLVPEGNRAVFPDEAKEVR